MKPYLRAIPIFVLLCSINLALTGQSHYSAIRNANVQIKSSLNNMPIAWATKEMNIKLNKETGDFIAELLVDDLEVASDNPEFKGATGENLGKYVIFSGTLPVHDVLENANNAIDRKIEMRIEFNGREDYSSFVFTMLKFQTRGYSVMATGTISIAELGIVNLQQLNDELSIFLSFTGQ